MPGFDGTGPAGMGPMTGGARGWCNPYGAQYAGYRRYGAPFPVPLSPGYVGPAVPRLGRAFWGRGRGLGWGRGWGPGRGRGWW